MTSPNSQLHLCPICGALCGPGLYCTIKHRDRAKYLRRRARERGFLSQAPSLLASDASPINLWPDPLDLGTLAMFVEQLGAGAEVWFGEAKAFSVWQAPDGFSWEVLSDGKGRLRRN